MPLPQNYSGISMVTCRSIPVQISKIVRQSWPPVASTSGQTAPVAASNNDYLTTFAGPNTTTTTILRGAFTGARASGVPDYPRNVVVVTTHATSVVAMTVLVTGIDQFNRILTETFTVPATGTSQTVTGKKAFKRVDRVDVTAASDASANSVVVGTGTVFGLVSKAALGGAGASVKEAVDGAIVTTGTLVAGTMTPGASPTIDPQGTYSPATAPNGSHTYDVWYLSDQPEQA